MHEAPSRFHFHPCFISVLPFYNNLELNLKVLNPN
jgi:hypothetical protein